MGALRIVERIRSFTMKIVIAVQHVLVTAALFLIYFIGFGIMRLLVLIFNRERGSRTEQSSWHGNPPGYRVTVDTAQRAS